MTRVPMLRRTNRLAQERAPAGIGKGHASGRGVDVTHSEQWAVGCHKACFTWNTVTPSPHARPRAVDRMVGGCRRPGSAWSGGRETGTAARSGPRPPRAYATCDASGVRGRAGRRSRLAKGTWEYHRAENMGAPRRRGHRSATGQRTSDATAAETPGQQRAGELVATSRVPPQHRAGAVQSARATGEARARRSSIGWNGGRGRSRAARASTYTAGTV